MKAPCLLPIALVGAASLVTLAYFLLPIAYCLLPIAHIS